MTIDDLITIFGSANLDMISLYNCHEANVIIDHAAFTKYVIQTLFTVPFSQGIVVQHPDSALDEVYKRPMQST